MHIPEHLEAEVEDALSEALKDPVTLLQTYLADLAEAANLPVEAPYWKGDPPPSVPLSITVPANTNQKRVGVVLNGRRSIVNGADVEHTIEQHEETGRERQRISVYLGGHESHYHALRPIRAELRTRGSRTYLRLHFVVAPCRGEPLVDQLFEAISDFIQRRHR